MNLDPKNPNYIVIVLYYIVYNCKHNFASYTSYRECLSIFKKFGIKMIKHAILMFSKKYLHTL